MTDTEKSRLVSALAYLTAGAGTGALAEYAIRGRVTPAGPVIGGFAGFAARPDGVLGSLRRKLFGAAPKPQYTAPGQSAVRHRNPGDRQPTADEVLDSYASATGVSKETIQKAIGMGYGRNGMSALAAFLVNNVRPNTDRVEKEKSNPDDSVLKSTALGWGAPAGTVMVGNQVLKHLGQESLGRLALMEAGKTGSFRLAAGQTAARLGLTAPLKTGTGVRLGAPVWWLASDIIDTGRAAARHMDPVKDKAILDASIKAIGDTYERTAMAGRAIPAVDAGPWSVLGTTVAGVFSPGESLVQAAAAVPSAVKYGFSSSVPELMQRAGNKLDFTDEGWKRYAKLRKSGMKPADIARRLRLEGSLKDVYVKGRNEAEGTVGVHRTGAPVFSSEQLKAIADSIQAGQPGIPRGRALSAAYSYMVETGLADPGYRDSGYHF